MTKDESKSILKDILGRRVMFYTRGGPTRSKLEDYAGVVVGIGKGNILVRIGNNKRSRLFSLDEIGGLRRVSYYLWHGHSL